MADDEPQILTPAEVAALLRRSPDTLRYWRTHGGGPPSWRSGRRVFYDRAAVLAWIDEQRTAGAHQPAPTPPTRLRGRSQGRQYVRGTAASGAP